MKLAKIVDDRLLERKTAMKFQVSTAADYPYFHVTHCVQKKSSPDVQTSPTAELTSRILVLSKSCNTNVSGAAEVVPELQRSTA